MFLSFGNGDIDTLSIHWTPQIESRHNHIKDLNIAYLYNGVKIDQWDFISTPDLFYEVEFKNRKSTSHPTATDPIYIKIPKRPNPDEFD